MWLSKQGKENGREQTAETGAVTLCGETVAVELDSERRGLEVYGPGGYRWRPKLGQKVLVLKTAEGVCVVGTPLETGLSEGEVGLAAEGDAAVTLKKDGRILLEGSVEVDGTLTIAGESLENMVQRIVAELMAGTYE